MLPLLTLNRQLLNSRGASALMGCLYFAFITVAPRISTYYLRRIVDKIDVATTAGPLLTIVPQVPSGSLTMSGLQVFTQTQTEYQKRVKKVKTYHDDTVKKWENDDIDASDALKSSSESAVQLASHFEEHYGKEAIMLHKYKDMATFCAKYVPVHPLISSCALLLTNSLFFLQRCCNNTSLPSDFNLGMRPPVQYADRHRDFVSQYEDLAFLRFRRSISKDISSIIAGAVATKDSVLSTLGTLMLAETQMAKGNDDDNMHKDFVADFGWVKKSWEDAIIAHGLSLEDYEMVCDFKRLSNSLFHKADSAADALLLLESSMPVPGELQKYKKSLIALLNLLKKLAK